MRRILLIAGLLLIAVAAVPAVRAATTVPQTITYNGHLLDSDGNAVTSEVTIRFSYWSSADFQSGNLKGDGSIDTGSGTYAGWQEEHTVTPNSDGYFTVQLGSNTSLPDFSSMDLSTLLNLHLQVEVKSSGDADTSYELLDRDPDDDSSDRAPVDSVPFALNADLIDQRAVGTGSGSIPVLGSGGFLSQSGVTADAFTIDADDSDSGNIELRFGNDLGKKLSYNQSQTRFEFNDDLYVDGNINLTGLVDGVDVASLSSDNDVHLKASSGAGLNLSVAEGSYRLRGTVTNFTGTSSVVLNDNATNYVFFGSGGLTVTTSGFPGNESIIRVAEVTTSGGDIDTINDRRTFNSDDREKTVERVYAPGYEGVAFEPDGSSNVGRLRVHNSGSAVTNYYSWTSSRSSLQDYDVVLHGTVASDFVRWGEDPLIIAYRSTSADTAVTQMDIEVFDTTGTQVTLSGSTADLASTDWTTTQVEFTGSPTWQTGEDFLIKMRLHAKDSEEMQLGSLQMQYVTLPKE